MTTARSIIEQAQKDAGVLGLGQTMNAEDTNDAFIRFKNMIAQWQKRRWLVPSLYDIGMPGNNRQSNLIGPDRYWNTPRPDKILAAYFLQGDSGVSFPLWPLYSYEDYSKISLKDLNSWPTRYFYDNTYPYGNVFIWPIPSSSYEIHLILKSALGLTTSIANAFIFAGGSGYINGVYVGVPLINLVSIADGQVGLSATANVTIAGGIVTAFAIQNGGNFYKLGDTVTLDTTIVGAGIGFVATVNGLSSSLDSEMEMPEEYEEAMIANLAIRLCVMYQEPVSDDLKKLARTSLKTIIGANTQVPVLRMPGMLRGYNSAGIVNADSGDL